MHAHGGIFKTPEIPQRALAAAFDTPVSVSATASEGGAWGMALLAGYRMWAEGRSLEDYLEEVVFADTEEVTIEATPEEVAEYARYLDRFVAALALPRTAVEVY